MRLNSALVSSFLFVAAVLADPHPEKQHPPFLNRVEKSIDPGPTTVFPFDPDQWAGAVWVAELRYIKYTAGTFTVPDVYSVSGPKDFNIVVAIGAYDKERAHCGAAVGITVRVNGTGGVNYEAWGQWYPGEVQRAPDGFSIMRGHRIRATVEKRGMNYGFVSLMNLDTNDVWTTRVRGSRSCINHWDADLIVTTIPSDDQKDQVKVPNFGEVSFKDILINIPGRTMVPLRTGKIVALDITQAVTSVMVNEDDVIVAIDYIRDGYTVFPYGPDQWAGAVWRTTQGTIKSAAGTFTVPDAYSVSGPKGFNIVVAVGAYDKDRAPCGAAVGITVRVNGTGGANYEAWGQWYPGDVQRAPDWFSIRPGHRIRASVQKHGTSYGFVSLTNLDTKTAVWQTWVRGRFCIDDWDADWIVTTIPSEDQKAVKVPNFGEVYFTDIVVDTSGVPRVPDRAGEIVALKIMQDYQVVTSVMVNKVLSVAIDYIPNSYTVFPYDPDQWAGAVLRSMQGTIESAAGTFTVPSVYSASSPKSFNIVVAIGAYDSPSPCGAAVGITVQTNGMEGADYKAWGQWYPDDLLRAPDSFSIRTGDQIRAIVRVYDGKTGLVGLMNLKTGQFWLVFVYGYLSCNQWDADLVVTTIPSKDQVKVPNFHVVAFTHIILGTSDPKVPDGAGQIITLNLEADNRNITEVDVYRNFVIIRYNSDG